MAILYYRKKGAKKTVERASQVLPLQKVAAGKGFSHAEGGHQNVVYTRAFDVLAMLKGGAESFYSLKKKGGGGKETVLPWLEYGGGATSPYCSAPPCN